MFINPNAQGRHRQEDYRKQRETVITEKAGIEKGNGASRQNTGIPDFAGMMLNFS